MSNGKGGGCTVNSCLNVIHRHDVNLYSTFPLIEYAVTDMLCSQWLCVPVGGLNPWWPAKQDSRIGGGWECSFIHRGCKLSFFDCVEGKLATFTAWSH